MLKQPLYTILAASAASLWMTSLAHGILHYSNPFDAAYESAPTGTLAGSGWQFQGQWGSFLGTAIAPSYFITAKHVGGKVGNGFTYDGTTYTTVAKFDSPNSDLRIWQVSGTFSSWASIYDKSDEVGQDFVVFGRGRDRGADVVDGQFGLRGWQWGSNNGTQRWGENTVSSVVSGGSSLGNLLAAEFNAGTGPGGRDNEAHLAYGDSGGAVFIQDNGVWKLAGINYAVDAYYSQDGTIGSGFNAAIFNEEGLYFGNDISGYTYVNQPNAGRFYSTRVSDHLSWINGVVPEPSQYALLLGLGMLLIRVVRLKRKQ